MATTQQRQSESWKGDVNRAIRFTQVFFGVRGPWVRPLEISGRKVTFQNPLLIYLEEILSNDLWKICTNSIIL